jgi:hypothetical protein
MGIRSLSSASAISGVKRSKAWDQSTLPITGGTITISGGYRIHTFSTVGQSTFSVGKPITVEIFCWGAGGGGGTTSTGGTGGYSTGLLTINSSADYAVVVGGGGATGIQILEYQVAVED